jgi:hypothetical protein
MGACLRYFPRSRKAEVLQRLGLSVSDWEAMRLAWSVAIEENTAASGTLLADWSEAFEQFGQRLRELLPSVETLDIGALLPAPVAAVSEPAPAARREAEPQQRALPSYLKEPGSPARPRPDPAKDELPTAEMMPVPLDAPVLPFVSGPPTLLAAPPASRKPHPLGSGTVDLATPRKAPPTLPFQAAPPAPSAAEALDFATKLTMNQYAALKAELAASAAEPASVWSKYGVEGQAERDAVEQHWQAELARDPAKQRHFEAVSGQYFRQWAQKPR